MPSIGENTPEKIHQKIEFYLSKFPTRDHSKKYRKVHGFAMRMQHFTNSNKIFLPLTSQIPATPFPPRNPLTLLGATPPRPQLNKGAYISRFRVMNITVTTVFNSIVLSLYVYVYKYNNYKIDI